LLENATEQTSNATMFAYAGIDPKHYDMMELDLKGKAIT
jgi:dTDP-glucose pyrophosphorylase